jgi:hypothetical protein
MPKSRAPSSDTSSVTVQGPVTNAAIIAGKNNVARVSVRVERPLPAPESVDIRAALAEITAALRQLARPSPGEEPAAHAKKIDHAMDEAREEAEKPEPDRREVGRALDRALEYAKAANGFADAWVKLEPHVLAAASWLGEHGHALLRTLGLT